MINSRNAMVNAFKQYLMQIYKDAMLILLMIAPLLCGLFFKYGIPYANGLIEKYFKLNEFFDSYYLLFDLFLGSITPLLYCFASAYLILGEIDDNISGYLSVTPLGKRGYLISRLCFPAGLSFVISVGMMSVFTLTEVSFSHRIGISLLGCLLGIMEALLVVSISGNRVEGMAVSKLSGLFFLGLPIPFFVKGGVEYLMFFLPSFWVSKYAMQRQPAFLIIGLGVSFIWIWLLYQKFINKINR